MTMASNDYDETEMQTQENDSRRDGRPRGSNRDRRETERDREYRGRFRREQDHDDPESERFRKLFIGGLSYDTTDSTLLSYFEEYGEVVDSIVMKEPGSKRSRGFGFVTYKTSKMVEECLNARPHRIDGREVDIKRAMPRTESQYQMSSSDARDTTRKLFVGGLADRSTEASIREAFEEFGNVDQVDLMMDKVTNRHRGFAFITFTDSDTVDYCVIKKYFEVDGKTVEVKKAESKQTVKSRLSVMNQKMNKAMNTSSMGMGMSGMGSGMGNMGQMGTMGGNTGMSSMGNMGQMGNMGGMGMGNMGMGMMGNMGGMGQMGTMGNMGQMGTMGQMGSMGGMGDNKAITSGGQDVSSGSSGQQQGQNPMNMMNMMGFTPAQFQMMANMMTMMGMMNPNQMGMMSNQMGMSGNQMGGQTGTQMGMSSQSGGLQNYSGQGTGTSWGSGTAQFGESYGESSAGPVKGAMAQRENKPYSRDSYR